MIKKVKMEGKVWIEKEVKRVKEEMGEKIEKEKIKEKRKGEMEMNKLDEKKEDLKRSYLIKLRDEKRLLDQHLSDQINNIKSTQDL